MHDARDKKEGNQGTYQDGQRSEEKRLNPAIRMRKGRWIERIVCCGGGMTKARLTVNREKKLIGDRMKEEDVACDPCN